MLFITLYIIFCSISASYSARILAVFPTPCYSHQLTPRALMVELSVRGHEVVMLTTDPVGNKVPKNYREIDLSFLYKYVVKKDWGNVFNKNKLISMYGLYIGFGFLADETLGTKEVKDLINNPNEHFDLVIFEWSSFATFTALGEHFNCPVIGFRPLGLRVEVHDALANPVTPSYLPVAFMQHRDDFIGRVTNTFLIFSIRLMYRFLILPIAEQIAKKHFPKKKIYIGDLEKNVSLTFVYSNPVLMGVRPLVPSIIEVGGIHLGQRNHTLPEDVKTYLDNSKQGVIFFSLGSSVSTEFISQETMNSLIDTFSELPYNILLKLDVNLFNKTNKNVMCAKWLPQEAVLGHPNMRVFVSHGGLLSVWESVSKAVPIIAIPFHTDQFYNAHRIVELGIGLQLDFPTIIKSDLVYAINEIINNNSYKQRIEKLSKLIMDHPIPVMDKAIWWTEYVIRHKGAPHFKSRAVGMPWYIYYSLDVICFIILILMIIYYIIYRILKFIHSILCKDKRKTKIQ